VSFTRARSWKHTLFVAFVAH
jgi:hypothetical protein